MRSREPAGVGVARVTARRRPRSAAASDVEHLREQAGEVAEHADVLRPLPGEQHGELARRRAAAEVRAVGRVPARPRPARPRACAFAPATSFGRSVRSRWAARHEPARRRPGRTRPATPPRRGRRRPSRGRQLRPAPRRVPAACRAAERDDLDRAVPVGLGASPGRCSSSTAWKLLPPKPNARQRRPPRVFGPRQPRPHLGVDVERRVRRPAAARPAASP